MNKKAEILFDAVTEIRPELVEQALDQPLRRLSAWRRAGALCAACLALTACLGWFGLFLSGGMGGSGDMSATDNCAPQAPSAEAPSEDGGERAPVSETFTAQVVEAREDALLVRPRGQWDEEPVEVSLEGLETLPELEPGDWVSITFTGEAREDGVLTGVTEITAAEP